MDWNSDNFSMQGLKGETKKRWIDTSEEPTTTHIIITLYFFFYKNIFHENIKAEIIKKIRILPFY